MLSTAIGSLPCAVSKLPRASRARDPPCGYLRDEMAPVWSPGSSLWPQERKIAAVIGAENLLRIELGVAALGPLLRGLHGGGPLLELGVLHPEIDTPLLHREPDAVTVSHQSERATLSGVGRHVQHDGTEGGAAHARVGDPDHILDALL